MNMMNWLYIALAVIAGLGILALLLIFVGRARQNRKRQAFLRKYNAGQRSSLPDEDVLEDEVETEALPRIVAQRPSVDPALVELGFDPLKDLVTEPLAGTAALHANAPLKQTHSRPVSQPKHLLTLYVMAIPPQVFIGYELLQALLSVGLRYGEMDIFHYYEDPDAETKQILFSACSATEPGVFDMTDVGAIRCPGLCLFMSADSLENPSAVFETLLETAQQLAEDLGGEVYDDERRLLTEESLQNYQARLEILE